MNRRKKMVPVVVITLLTWLVVGWVTLRFGPEDVIKISNYQLLITNLFFPLIFIASSLSFALLLNNTRRGALLGFAVTIFLILRLLKLTHPFYLIILVATLLAFELAFRKN